MSVQKPGWRILDVLTASRLTPFVQLIVDGIGPADKVKKKWDEY